MAVTLQEAQTRLEEAGLRLGDRYARGASGKGQKWASGAAAAEANYTEGVQRSIAQKRFSKGVSEAGPTSYDEGVRNKGAQNWPTGMQQAGPKYARKTAKFSQLWAQPLATPRAARRSPQNSKRILENIERFSKAAGF